MSSDNFKKVVDKLIKIHNAREYLMQDDIFDLCEEYGISLIQTERVLTELMDNGCHIFDHGLSEDEFNIQYNLNTFEAFDYAHIDYESLYRHVLEVDPSLNLLVDYVKNIRPAQHGEANYLFNIIKPDHKSKQRLFDMNLRSVINIAYQQYLLCDEDLADIIQMGSVGLLKSIEKYDVNSGKPFASYANSWIYGEIMRTHYPHWIVYYFPTHFKEKMCPIWIDYEKIGMPEINTKDYDAFLSNWSKKLNEENEKIEFYLLSAINQHNNRIELDQKIYECKATYKPILDFLKDEENFTDDFYDDEVRSMIPNLSELCDPEYHAINNDTSFQLNKALSEFDSREKGIIELRYGLNGNRIHTLEEVGKIYDLTRERIRQIEAKTLKKLKNSDNLKDLKPKYNNSYSGQCLDSIVLSRNSTKSKSNNGCDKNFDVRKILKNFSVEYIDKRSKGGNLWIIGGENLSDIVEWLKPMGYIFHFKKDGGRCTKNRPAWWTK